MQFNRIIEKVAIPSIEEQIRQEVSPIRMTRAALDKANYISDRICTLMGTDLEIGFFLLNGPEKRDRVISDVYIGHDQTVSATKCDISGYGRILSCRRIRNELKRDILGWGHSHANMETSYSDIDDRTIIDLLKDIGLTKEARIDVDLTQKIESIGMVGKDNRQCLNIVFRESKTPFRIYSPWFDALSKDYASQMPFEIFKETSAPIRYFIGLTFNARKDDPFRAIAYMYNSTPRRIEGSIGLEIIETGQNLIDKEKIDNHLYERITTLQEESNRQLLGIKREYSKANDYMISCHRLIDEVTGEAVSLIVAAPDRQLKRIEELRNCLGALTHTSNRYLSIPAIEALKEQKKLADGIAGCREHAMRHLINGQEKYDEAAQGVIEELSCLGMLSTRRKPLTALLEQYQELSCVATKYCSSIKFSTSPCVGAEKNIGNENGDNNRCIA